MEQEKAHALLNSMTGSCFPLKFQAAFSDTNPQTGKLRNAMCETSYRCLFSLTCLLKSEEFLLLLLLLICPGQGMVGWGMGWGQEVNWVAAYPL